MQSANREKESVDVKDVGNIEAIVGAAQVWAGGRWREKWGVGFDRKGRIVWVGPWAARPHSARPAEWLGRRALLPGFVDAHSHAFQRVLRGRVQRRPVARADTFWTWRELMYAVADRVDVDAIEIIAALLYAELLRAGWTTVVEFHYLHGPRPWEAPEVDSARAAAGALVRAAHHAGIRLVLLPVAYLRAGFDGAAPRGAQRRFAAPGVQSFLEWVEAIADDIAATGPDRDTHAGVAVHSVRAVLPADLSAVAEWARRRGVVLHVHAAEQPAEVRACRDATGLRPVELLERTGVLGAHTTVVHATHLAEAEVDALARTEATVCACPTTEADLGDGIGPMEALVRRGVPLALGTDSHARTDPFEEMRWLEYGQRLATGRRVVLGGVDDGGEVSAGVVPFDAATRGGARSAGLDAGVIEGGALADLVAVDLDAPALAGWSSRALRDAIALGAGAGVVTDVWVGGKRVVRDRVHEALEGARRRYEALVSALMA